MLCYKSVIVNSVHTGDNKDDGNDGDDDDENNNNNRGSSVKSSVYTANKMLVRSTKGPGNHAEHMKRITGIERTEPTIDHQPSLRRNSGAVRLLT